MESEAVHGVVSRSRLIELDQKELLHPRPEHVREPVSIFDRKTPNVTLGG